MASPVRELEAAALALPVEDRARLAERLLSSLDDATEEIEGAWVAEVRERLARYRSGEIEALPLDQAMTEARKRAQPR